jgi:eukaryotic-like serine/threonine-protein kinase
MPLLPGTRLGPYEIVAPIGAGGMGEVYKARDTRLQRQVAIKVVPASIARDAEALARFEREAQAVAALSHPNILALHDIGRESGAGGDVTYAVMELLDGRTLREVLASGALPVRKALEYGRQVTDGLAAAHDRGIVHRDVKPENIFITTDGRVKLLDFGLALVQTAAARSSATETVLAQVDTTPGTVLGTIGYMAPEQVRGQVVDSRADIFAFGAVLYEMIGGTRAFAGATPADTMSAILNRDPGELVPTSGGSHPALDRIVRRALEKEPAQRFQSARDLGFALEAVASGSGATSASAHASIPPTVHPRRLPAAALLGIGVMLGLALGAGAWLAFVPARDTASAGVSRFTLPATPFQVGFDWVAVSPDGRTLAWGGNTSSAASQNLALWVRRLDNTAADIVRNVDDVWRAVFMSDNKRLLCVNQRQLFTLDIETGRRTVVWAAPAAAAVNTSVVGAFDVGPHDRIVVSRNREVAIVDNGALRVVARPEAGERGLTGPRWMPDGKHLLVSARLEDSSLAVFVIPVDGGARRPIALPQDITAPMVAPDGTILYGQNGILWGQRVDPSTLALVGGPVRVANDLTMDSSTGFMGVSVSPSGVLALRSPSASQVQLEWVDRTGRPDRKVGATDSFANFDVAPDGRIVASRREPFLNGNSMWLIDPARQITAEIGPFEGQSYSDPTFSPDGSRLAVRKGSQIVVRTLQGATETVLRDWTGFPDSWSRDGRFLTVGRPIGGNYELWAVSLDDPSKDVAIVSGMTLVDEGRFSPDGKWVAYHVAQKAMPDVFVTPFPPTTERLQISTSGGVQPRWSPDGRELYFLDLSGQLMSAEMPGGNPRQAKAAQPLFRTDLSASSAMDQFAVSADGKQFLLRRPLKAFSNDAPVQVILNWRSLMTPAGR